MDYIECRLTIQNNQSIEYDVVGGFPIRGALHDDKLTEMTVKRLSAWIGSHSKDCAKEDLQVLGLHLYRMLFCDEEISAAFATTYTRFQSKFSEYRGQSPDKIPNFRLRLTLIFHEEAESLAGYPWEFIFVPIPSIEKGFFLTGGRTELILTRFVPQPGLIKKLQTETNELRILVAWSHPKELRTIDTSVISEIEKLIEDIQGLSEKDRVQVEQLPKPTHELLRDTVNRFKPHIVHFIGHGKAGEVALIKKQEDIDYDIAKGGRGDEADFVNSDSMRAVFATYPPRLVFLHACNGAAVPESLGIFKSTARQLLHADIPAVVAMQYEISNEDASLFAKTFYQQIGEGMSIDEAVKEGRRVLGERAPAWGHPRFGTPVVYLQSEDGVIFSKERGVPPPNNSTQLPIEPSSKVECTYGDCDFKVSPDQKNCGCERKRRLMRCRNPECRRVVPKSDDPCLWCDYDPLEEAVSASKPESVSAHWEVVVPPALKP